MKIDQAVINLLKTYFVPRRGTSHVAGDVLPGGTDTFKLGAPTNRWDTIYARQVIADTLTGGDASTNADTVDGFHASAISTANTLLALDASQAYPETAYPDALLVDGSRQLMGNLSVWPGATIDGVDIDVHVTDSSHHISGMGADDHAQYMHISSQRTVSAVHTYQPGVPTSPMVLGSNAQGQTVVGFRADQLNKGVTAGEGLTGGGLLTSSITMALDFGAPSGSIEWDTGNVEGTDLTATRTDHKHAITASYNPGASASLLRTNTDGSLYIGGDFGVDSDTLYVDASEGAVYINAGVLPTRRGALTVHPENVNQRGLVIEQLSGQVSNLFTVFDSSGGDLIVLTNAGDLESGDPNFVSGLTGWQITATGDAEFWNATIRGELHASVFVADEMHATGGTLAVMNAGKVADPGSSGDNVMGSTGADFDLRMQASWDTGLCYFAYEDVIRLKFMGDDGGLDLFDVYVEVMSSVGSVQGRDLGEGEPGYYILDVRRRSGGASGLEIPKGTAGVLWGNSTDTGYSGGMILTSDLSFSPYMDVFTIDNSTTYEPWDAQAIQPRVRVGNLGGVLGGSVDEWGIAFGTNLADVSNPYGVFSDLRASLHGISQEWWDLDGNIRGQIDPTATGPDTLFWLGTSGADPKFEVTGDGLVRMGGAFIGPRGGVLVDDGILWLSFDGDKRLGGVETMSLVDWLVPHTATGSIYSGWGQYGGGLVVGDTVTNLIENPSFRTNITDGWLNNGNGTRTWDITPENVRSSNGSFKFVAGSTSSQIYTTVLDSLPNGSTIWASCWMKVDENATGTPGRLIIYNVTSPGTVATGYSSLTIGEWELVTASWTNNQGGARNIRIYLGNYANNSSTVVWFDEVQTSIGSYPRPYVDGDKPGGVWAGVEGNSHSSRAGQDLEYYVVCPTNWTISLWWMPTATAAEMTSTSSRIFEWYGSSNDRIILYQPAAINEIRIYHQVNGDLEDIDITGLSRGVPHHILITYTGTALYWWIDNANEGFATHGQSWGATPNTFAVGSDVFGGNRAQGIISDLFILNKSVDASFVNAVYTATNPVSISNDIMLKVFDPEMGSTTITPRAFMVRGSDNAMGISTNPDWMVIGGIPTQSGDMVLGENRVGSSAIFWDGSEGSFKFHADGQSVNSMRWTREGMIFTVPTNEQPDTAIKWIRSDLPDDPVVQISVNVDTGDESWMKIKHDAPPATAAWTQLYAWGTGAEVQVYAFGQTGVGGATTFTVWDTDTAHYFSMNQKLIIGDGLVVGGYTSDAPGNGNMMYYGSLLSNKGGVNRTVYGAHYFITRVNAWNAVVKSSSGPTLITHTTLGIPDNCKAVLVRVVGVDSGAWPANTYVAVGPSTSDPYAVSAYPQGIASGPTTLPDSDTGWCPCTAGGDIYFKCLTSGSNSMTVYIYVYGYVI